MGVYKDLRKKLIYEGLIFNDLKVISFWGVDRHRNKMYKCQCLKCGRFTYVRSKAIISKNIHSCGHCANSKKRRKGQTRKPIKRIESGYKFNEFKVIKYIGRDSKDKEDLYLVVCSCGNMLNMRARAIINKKINNV